VAIPAHRVRTGPIAECLENRTLLNGDVSPPDVMAIKGEVARAAQGPAGYQIQLRFLDDGLTTNQKAAFTSAAVRWQQIILGDLPDVTEDFNGDQVDETIDDLRIDITALEFDGPGGSLGWMGPEYVRASDGLPITGVMEIDSADFAAFEANGTLDAIVFHEMGHVLGFGTLWYERSVAVGIGGPSPRYTGPAALAQYRAIFGATTASWIPVENTGGQATADNHWPEHGEIGTAFGTELMTGSLDSGVNPLSRISIAQFADLGYQGVNLNAAEPYAPPGGGNPAPTIVSLSDSPDPASSVPTILLTANGVADNGSVATVRFYRESNGIPGLQVLQVANGDVPGDLLVGTDGSAVGGFAATISIGGLVNGTYTYYAQATDNQNLVSAVVSSTNTVSGDTAPYVSTVAINGGAVERSNVNSITLQFSESTNVGALVADGSIGTQVQLFNKANPSSPLPLTRFQFNSATNTLSIDLTTDGFGGSPVTQLANGRYELRIVAAAIRDAGGNPLGDTDGVADGTVVIDRSSGSISQDFFRLGGDQDGDADTDLADLGTLGSVFGTNSAGGDCDGDGDTDLNDLSILSSNFNSGLPPGSSVGNLRR
jgi:hypothetical protein